MQRQEQQVGALLQNGHATVITQPLSPPAAGEILVRVRASLLSPGTELSAARQARAQGVTEAGNPQPFGYQNAGEVVEIGDGVKAFAPGDRVACMGSGARHADWAVVPQNLAAKLPANVSFEEGAYGHLAITALQAIRRGQVEIGEYVLVVGMGLVGQLTAQLARAAGARVMAVDSLRGRLEIAKACGAHAAVLNDKAETVSAEAGAFTCGRGFDMAVLAFGGQGTEAMNQVRSLMKRTPDGHKEGRIVIVGALETTTRWASGMSNLTVYSSARTGPGYHDDAWEHGQVEYPHPWVRWTTAANMELVLWQMAQGVLRVKPLTTHRVPLAEVDRVVTAHIEQPDRTLGTILTMG